MQRRINLRCSSLSPLCEGARSEPTGGRGSAHGRREGGAGRGAGRCRAVPPQSRGRGWESGQSWAGRPEWGLAYGLFSAPSLRCRRLPRPGAIDPCPGPAGSDLHRCPLSEGEAWRERRFPRVPPLPCPLCLLRWEENGYKGVLKHLMRWSVLFPGTAGLRGSRGRGAGHRLGRGGVRQGEGAGAALPCPAPLCPGTAPAQILEHLPARPPAVCPWQRCSVSTPKCCPGLTS